MPVLLPARTLPIAVFALASAVLHLHALAAAAPVTKPDAATLHHGQKVRVAVLANDTGAITPATISVVQAPRFGTAVPDVAGGILYTHTTGAPAGDSFSYQVSGSGGTSAPAAVTLTFATTLRIANSTLNVPANPPPTAVQIRPAFGTLPFTQPVCLANPPGETDRLFVCEKTGRVKVIPSVTTADPTAEVFLDLAALLKARGETLNFTFEQGLLGLAFHPQYATNGYFYVFYSARSGPHSYERMSRFSVQPGNPNAADPSSELILIDQLDQAVNHNGGDLHFGPDGYLYISVGDEGSSFDGLNNSQTITKDFFSGVLRIDVDKGPGSVPPNPHPSIRLDAGVARYAVPKDNPFVPPSLGGSWDGRLRGVLIPPSAIAKVRSEFWAIGLRNPWRFSFDPLTGELWLGDLGQGLTEEVNLITRGGNYGWAWREGSHRGPKYRYTTAGFDALYHRKPLYEYVHTTVRGGSSLLKGNSCTGGVVYRGARFASLQGRYIFADYISGHIWALTRNGAARPTVVRLAGETGISAFGTDPSNGDVLMADYNNGRILRLTAATTGGSFPQTLSATGLFADLSDLSPAPGVMPYSPNVSFWSDFASKRRWFTVPDATSQMIWAREDAWTFPDGMIWVKHFDLPRTRSNPPGPNDPPASKRIETRVLVKNAGGVYGVSYRWNDAGTEATLAPDEGADFTVGVTQNGVAYNQRWHIPSRAECTACHSPSAGYALSFNTRQLNREGSMAGVAGNQLDLLHAAGYFAHAPESPNVLPRHLRADETAFPVEARVRSYLAVNCAYCHEAGGTAPTAWDARPHLTLEQMGILNVPPATDSANLANRLIVPNDLTHSVILNRVAVTNGFTRMPPLGGTELDKTGVALLIEWIRQSLPARQSYEQWRLAHFGSGTSAEGEPVFDADADGASNRDEWLAGTDPRDAASVFAPQVTADGSNASVTFSLPANRSAQVETSLDQANWSLWDVPGNQGLPLSGGSVTLSGAQQSAGQTFRLKVWEN